MKGVTGDFYNVGRQEAGLDTDWFIRKLSFTNKEDAYKALERIRKVEAFADSDSSYRVVYGPLTEATTQMGETEIVKNTGKNIDVYESFAEYLASPEAKIENSIETAKERIKYYESESQKMIKEYDSAIMSSAKSKKIAIAGIITGLALGAAGIIIGALVPAIVLGVIGLSSIVVSDIQYSKDSRKINESVNSINRYDQAKYAIDKFIESEKENAEIANKYLLNRDKDQQSEVVKEAPKAHKKY